MTQGEKRQKMDLLTQWKKQLSSLQVDVCYINSQIKKLEQELNPEDYWRDKLGYDLSYLVGKSIKINKKESFYNVAYFKNIKKVTSVFHNGGLAMVVVGEYSVAKNNISLSSYTELEEMIVTEASIDSIEIIEDTSVLDNIKTLFNQL